MSQAGDRRPGGAASGADDGTTRRSMPPLAGGYRPWRSRAQAAVLALAAALLAAVAWALLRGILDLGIGLAAVAFLGGWGIGASVRSGGASPAVAVVLALAAWFVGLVFTWLVALAILPGSSRTFLERLEATPFPDWMTPQWGLLEIVGLIVYTATAAYVARHGPTPTSGG